MSGYIVSYGHRYGGMTDEPQPDLFYSAKTLPNPFAEASLHGLTGNDPAVVEWLQLSPHFARLVTRIVEEAEDWRAMRGGVGYPNIAIFCIGGKHRSVAVANAVAVRLKLPVEHRDVAK